MRYNDLEEKLSVLLSKSYEKRSLSINEILTNLSGKGRFLLLIILSLPFCQPINIPGFSLPFGILISFIGLRISFGKHFWLPRKILLHRISSKKLRKICQKILQILNGIRFLIRPRFVWLCSHKTMQIFHGLLIMFLGMMLALPLPIPLSNFIPAWAIFFIGLGLVENDGVIVGLGYLLSVVSIVFLYFVFFSSTFVF